MNMWIYREWDHTRYVDISRVGYLLDQLCMLKQNTDRLGKDLWIYLEWVLPTCVHISRVGFTDMWIYREWDHHTGYVDISRVGHIIPFVVRYIESGIYRHVSIYREWDIPTMWIYREWDIPVCAIYFHLRNVFTKERDDNNFP